MNPARTEQDRPHPKPHGGRVCGEAMTAKKTKLRARRMTDLQIVTTWNMFEEAEPGISTERLMQQTADRCRCDAADVSEALWSDQQAAKRRAK